MTIPTSAVVEAVRISAGGIREYVHQAFVWLAVGGAIGLYAGHQIWAGPNLTPAATKLDVDLHVDGDLTLRGNPFPPGPNPPGPNPGPNPGPTPVPPSPIDPNKPWLPPGPRPEPPNPTPIELKPTATTPDEWRDLPGYPGFQGYGHEVNGTFYARQWRQEGKP